MASNRPDAEAYMAAELTHHFTAAPVAAPEPAAARPAPPIAPGNVLAQQYALRAQAIESRHNAQTPDHVAALRDKYAAPVFGSVSPWSLIEMLGQCIDPTDKGLYGASQQLHVLQIIDAMEAESAASDEMLLVALVHDLGKVLLLTGEAPENVVCFNRPVKVGAPDCGLDRCVFQWNHDEWAWSRLKGYLPDELGWLVRYHSMLPGSCVQYMDARDLDYCRRLFKPFSRYDQGTKSPFNVPSRRIGRYRALVERALPSKMMF
jgi:hypothetical protein